MMKLRPLIAACLAAATLVAAPAAQAYPVKTSGTTRATPQLAADIVARLSATARQPMAALSCSLPQCG